MGKKVIFSFGGAGMGGSWSGKKLLYLFEKYIVNVMIFRNLICSMLQHTESNRRQQ